MLGDNFFGRYMCNKLILQSLNDKGWTAPRVALSLKIKSPSVVYRSIDGGGSRRVRLKIAKILNQQPSVLWSDADIKQKMLDDLDYFK